MKTLTVEAPALVAREAFAVGRRRGFTRRVDILRVALILFTKKYGRGPRATEVATTSPKGAAR